MLACLPGWLAGALLTGLLFFLNPTLDFGAGAVARGVASYGPLLGVVSAVALAAVCRLSAARTGRALPWAASLVLGLTALAAGYHASHYSYFLPPGIGVRLVKAAVLVALAALITFYTALLHSLDDRPYGPRSRWGLVLAALAAVYFMLERREAFAPPPQAAPLPATVDPRERPRLYVLGVEGATLDAVLPLAGEGQLPFLADALARGAYGRLGSVPPVVTPAVWTTLATGKLPFRHQVLGRELTPTPLDPDDDLALLPKGVGFARWGTFGATARPLDGSDRRALTLWEMLARLEIPSGAVGWPASWPAQGPTAFVFSDRYFYGELEAAAAVPQDLVARGVLFRVSGYEIEQRLAGGTARAADRTLLEGAVASDLWRLALGRYLLDQPQDLRAFFLRLTGLGHASQAAFGGFSAATLEGSRRRDDRAAAAELVAYYRWVDGWLADFWAEQPEPKTLVVVSPHGFAAPSPWRRMLGIGGVRQRGWLSGPPDGLVLLVGDGIQAGRLLTDPELVDVVPTLLYALGLPSARDFDGRVLTEAFTPSFLARQPLTVVPSYETLLPASTRP